MISFSIIWTTLTPLLFTCNTDPLFLLLDQPMLTKIILIKNTNFNPPPPSPFIICFGACEGGGGGVELILLMNHSPPPPPIPPNLSLPASYKTQQLNQLIWSGNDSMKNCQNSDLSGPMLYQADTDTDAQCVYVCGCVNWDRWHCMHRHRFVMGFHVHSPATYRGCWVI